MVVSLYWGHSFLFYLFLLGLFTSSRGGLLWFGEEYGVEVRGVLTPFLSFVLSMTTLLPEVAAFVPELERFIANAYFPSCLIPLQRK